MTIKNPKFTRDASRSAEKQPGIPGNGGDPKRNRKNNRPRSHQQSDQQKSGLFIGVVHLGESEIEIAVVRDGQQVVKRAKSAFTRSPADADRWRQIAPTLQELERIEEARISGIGITFARNIDDQNPPFFTGRQRHELTRDLIECFPVPVATGDDTEAVLLAEAKWGTQRGRSRLMYIEIAKTGFAAGVIATNYLEDTPCVAPVQRINPCGFWESSVCEASLVERFKECAGPRYRNRNLLTREIWDLAIRGNASAQGAFKDEAIYLAPGLAQLIREHRPDVVILGGCVLQGAPELIDGIRHVLDTCSLVPKPTTELVASSFGDNAHLIGAAAVWHRRFARPPYTITARPGGTERARRGSQ